MLERGIYKPKTMNWKSARRHNQRRLQSLSGEEMQGNQSNKARSGIWFWSRGQRAFSNIRVFDPNAQCYQRKNLQKCYGMNEQEKKETVQFENFESWTKDIYTTCIFKNQRNKKKMLNVY